jgi:hypothetical protein
MAARQLQQSRWPQCMYKWLIQHSFRSKAILITLELPFYFSVGEGIAIKAKKNDDDVGGLVCVASTIRRICWQSPFMVLGQKFPCFSL